MPTITNLTQDQVDMLDFMWNEIETEQEFLDWYDALDEGQQRQADLLQRLVIMECVDEDMLSENNTDLTLAKSVLDRFML